ncbi:MAG: WG repeat-containing protein [Tissierellia bacterium]|mgnify:CR=1 FL=1|nr:WG repeat-containing protein [Tissierellia bacterium]
MRKVSFILIIILLIAGIVVLNQTGWRFENSSPISYESKKIEEDGFKVLRYNEQGDFIVSTAHNGMIIVTNGLTGDKERYGYINSDGKLIIEPKYKNKNYFNEGFVFLINESGELEVFNEYGKRSFEKAIKEIKNEGYNIGLAPGINKSGRAVLNLTNKKGEKVKRAILNRRGTWSYFPIEDMSIAVSEIYPDVFKLYKINMGENSTMSLVDSKGNKVDKISDDVYKVFPYSNDIDVIVKKSGLYGLADTKIGYIIEPFKYLKIDKINSKELRYFGYFVETVEKKGNKEKVYKEVILDENGRPVKFYVDKKFERLSISTSSPSKNFRFGVNVRGYSAVIIDINGDVVRETEWDEITEFSGDVGIYKLGDLYGFTDTDGRYISSASYDYAKMLDLNKAFVEKDGETFILNFKVEE